MQPWKVVGGLLLSAGAFCAIAFGMYEVASLEGAGEVARAMAIEPEPEEPVVEAAAPAAVDPIEERAPEHAIEVPDFRRMTALRAHRRARELGIAVDVMNGVGQRASSREWRFMRVHSQQVAPGTRVHEGTTIEIEADFPRQVRLFAGY